MRRVRREIAFAFAMLPVAACSLLVDLGPLSSNDASVSDASNDGLDASADAIEEVVVDAPPDVVGNDASDPYAAAVLADGPIAYYRLDEKSGMTVTSLVPSAPVGSFQQGLTWGAPALISKGGSSAAFSLTSGQDSNVTFGPNFAFAGSAPFSVEAWIKPATADAYYRHIMSKADRVSNLPVNGWDLLVYGNGSSLTLWLERCSGGVRATTAQVPIPAGAVTYAVGVYTGSSLMLYVNGTGSTAVADDGGVGATTTTAYMGSANGGYDENHGFIGEIDEVAIYDKALSATSIAAHYAAGK